MPTNEDPFDQLTTNALSINPKAMRTCPWCVYELEGLLKDGEVQPCPECGREVSGIINLTVWGKRSRHIRLLKFLTFCSGPCAVFLNVLLLFALPLAIAFALDRNQTGMDIVSTLFWGVPITTALIAFAACYRWQYLREPKSPIGYRLLISTIAGVTNILWILPIYAIAFPWLY